MREHHGSGTLSVDYYLHANEDNALAFQCKSYPRAEVLLPARGG